MFQFPGFPLHRLAIHLRVTGLLPAGFPHSDVKGSMPACGSPLLFAACHVLLRRLVPWHPPCALVRLITSFLRLTLLSASILRLIASNFRSIDLHYCNWSFKTFFSRLLMCSCQGALRFSPLQGKSLVVGRSGLEPPTSRLSGECSNQLS